MVPSQGKITSAMGAQLMAQLSGEIYTLRFIPTIGLHHTTAHHIKLRRIQKKIIKV